MGTQRADNSITWTRRVILQFLRSFFRHSGDYKYDEDKKKSAIVVVDSKGDLTDLPESTARVIVRRMDMRGETITVTNNIDQNDQMFTHGAFVPKLGLVGIYCEARNPVEAEFIASKIESILILHKDELYEKSVGVGAPSISAVSEPISGTKYFSVLVTVPTNTQSTIRFSYKNPQMLQDIAMDMGIGTEGVKVKVKT